MSYDESHRLKAMPQNYDVKLFNQLYSDTQKLRQKLAFEIDARKFGVDTKELISWFDVKFIYAFNKYYGDERLKGYIINALRTYKQRLIINLHQPQYVVHQTVDIDDVYGDLDIGEPLDEQQENLLESAKNYLKENLSDDAYFILEIELNPPNYIITQLSNPEQKKMPKLSNQIIAEYLGIDNEDGINYVKKLRLEISEITERAKNHFSLNP